jgi:hypothetical protein
MEDNSINEMISAYAIGCMDQRNFIQFKKYINSEGQMPSRELGVLQNVVALIPTILEIDVPEPKLKDKVAKEIVKYQEEIKVKIRSQKEKSRPIIKSEAETDFQKPDNTLSKEKTDRFTKSENLLEVKKDKTKTTVEKEDEQKLRDTANSKLSRDHVFDDTPLIDRSSSPWALIILFTLFVITAIMLIYFYQKNTELNEQINIVNQKLNNLQAELRKEKDFLEQNKLLIDFLNSDDLEIVRLEPTDIAGGSMGQLFLSFKEGKGILRITNLPDLEESHNYQLWFVSKNETIPILSINSKTKTSIFVISNLPYIDKKEVELIRITEESEENPKLPTGSSYLFGAIAH